MKLATIRTNDTTQCVRVDTDSGVAVEVGQPDVGALLRLPDWPDLAEAAGGREHDAAGLDLAPLIVRPDKIVCVGLNYRSHILETGNQLPQHPALFAKYSRALIGAHDDIALPSGSIAVDWEAELAVIIGRPVRHAGPEEARSAIAGYSVLNDVSVRDWQFRTSEWLQGKTFEGTTPLGPWLETDAGGDGRPQLDIECVVDGEVMQSANTGDLVFGPVDLVCYISSIVTLDPGDVISTGTPGGVGSVRNPPRFLQPGAVVETRIAGIGECRNVCRAS